MDEAKITYDAITAFKNLLNNRPDLWNGCDKHIISDAFVRGFEKGYRYADKHPSDETIMLILNCIGYEEKSWVEFVRKELEKRKMKHTCLHCQHRADNGVERFNGDTIELYFLCSKKSKQGVKVSVTLDHKKCNEFELKDEK